MSAGFISYYVSPALSKVHFWDCPTSVVIAVVALSIGLPFVWRFLIVAQQDPIKGKGTSRLPLPPGDLGIPYVTDDSRAMLSSARVKTIQDRFATLGPIFKNRMHGRATITIGDPQEVKRILSAEHDLVEAKSPPSMVGMMGNDSVIISTNGAHLRLRKILNNAFTAKALHNYLPHIVPIAEKLGERILKGAPAYPEVKRYTFQVIAELVMGFDKDWFEGEHWEQIYSAWIPVTHALISMPIPLPGTRYFAGLTARKFFTNKIEESLNKARQELKSMAPDAPRKVAHKLLEATDEKGKPFTMKQLQDIAINVLFAGHETTATALTLLLHTLALRTDVSGKLQAEQQQVIASHGEQFTEMALHDMTYLNAVVKETLRHHVIVGGVQRVALKTFDVGGYRVSKGWQVYLSLRHALSQDPRWIDLPEDHPLSCSKFAPERWLTPEGGRTGAWMPFGVGPRMCLGYQLALLELKVLIAVLVRSYAWNLAEPHEEWLQFPLPVPMKGLPLNMTRRDAHNAHEE